MFRATYEGRGGGGGGPCNLVSLVAWSYLAPAHFRIVGPAYVYFHISLFNLLGGLQMAVSACGVGKLDIILLHAYGFRYFTMSSNIDLPKTVLKRS